MEKRRLNSYEMAMVMMSFMLSVNMCSMGGTIGEGRTFLSGLAAILIGFVILSALAIVSGLMGWKSRCDTAIIWKNVFGEKGFLIFSFCVAISMAIFAIFDFWNCGKVISNLMPGHPALGFSIGIVFIVAVSAIGSVTGITGVKWISVISMPIGLILFLYLTYLSIDGAGGMEAILSYSPEQNKAMSFSAAISLFVSSYISSTPVFSDLTKDAATKKAVFIGMPCGILVLVVQFFLGQIGVISSGAYGLVAIGFQLGGAALIATSIFTAIAQTNTVPTANLMYSTQLAAVLKANRKAVAVIIPILAGIGSFIVEYVTELSIISAWANFTGVIVLPALGVTFADYWVIKRGKINLERQGKNVYPNAVIAMAAGMAVGLIGSYFIKIPLPTVISMFVSFLVHLILSSKSKRKRETLVERPYSSEIK